HRVVVPDVDRERLAAVAIEHDHANHAAQAREEVALAALVVVQPADHALPRPDEVRLPDLLARQRRRPHQLDEPSPVVVVPAEREQLDALDQVLLTPFARTKSLTS